MDEEGNGEGKQEAEEWVEEDLYQDHQGLGGLCQEKRSKVQAVHDKSKGGGIEESSGKDREGKEEEDREGGDEGG